MKPFSRTFAELRGGEADQEAGNALAEVIREVKRLSKAGKVTITIDIEPVDKAGVAPRVFITETITAKVPRAVVDSTLFFTDEHNDPTRQDPQQKLFDRQMKPVPAVDLITHRTPLPGSLGSGPLIPPAADGGPRTV